MKPLRPYQRAACDAFYDHIFSGGRECTIEAATGTGKAYVIATICKEIIAAYPKTRILVTVHTRELIRQNAQELLSLWPQAPIGINSAGLNRRDWQSQIIFGGIQSIHKHTDILGTFDLVIVDEAHLLSPKSESMYQRLFAHLREAKPNLVVLKLTATPFRLDNGRFQDVVYQYGIAQGIQDGYLSPLITKAMTAEIDTSKVHVRGGEFVATELEGAAMEGKNVPEAVDEIIAYGRERRAWLVFCVSIKHAEAVQAEMERRGVKSAIVTSKTPKEDRDKRISAFARGELQAIVNVSVLTTGFNVPHVDMIALLRPTMSPGLAIQMIGRGTRIAKDKEDCLVLDFARILKTHGPIDRMSPPERKKRKGKEKDPVVPIRICPECNAIMPLHMRQCEECGTLFPREEREIKTEAHADGESVILSTQERPRWVDVKSWRVSIHRKDDASAPVLRLSYLYGLVAGVNEFMAFEGRGPAPKIAARRWSELTGKFEQFTPQTVQEAFERRDELKRPARIMIARDGRYFKIVKSEHAPMEMADAA